MDDLDTPIHSGITPSLHPASISGLTDDEELLPVLHPVVEAFKTSYTLLAEIHTARKTVQGDSTLTPDGRILVVADYADKRQAAAIRAIEVATRQVDSSIKQIEGALSAPLRAGADRGVIASEVRQHAKAMETGKRMTFVKDAIERGDADTIASLLGAPAYLSGMSELEKDHHLRQWHLRKDPSAAKRLDLLVKAKDVLDTHAPKLLTEVEKAMGTKYGLVQKLRERKAQVAAALR